MFENYPTTIVHADAKLLKSYIVLEAWNASDCTMYPQSDHSLVSNVSFTAENATTAGWVAKSQNSGCGQSMNIDNNSLTNGQIDVIYRSPIA
jgi:hypothetical protein